MRKSYGVRATLGVLPGRVTLVIDARGVVRSASSPQLRVEEHAQDALDVVERISRCRLRSLANDAPPWSNAKQRAIAPESVPPIQHQRQPT